MNDRFGKRRGRLTMRTKILIACVAALAATGAVAQSAWAAGTNMASAECRKIAARYEHAARGKKGTNAWMAAEYWATEARSYCETNHTHEGVQAYEKALEQIKGG